jgi:hypothetical protein
MSFLFFFMDGVGLGKADPDINPFARAEMPTLQALLEGRRLVHDPYIEEHGLECQQATLLAMDACLGVQGLPQSATGQAVLLTGVNVPAAIGYHYGPKPNSAVAAHVKNGNLFNRFKDLGKSAGLLNAYPQGYFDAIHSGKRLYSSVPLAVTSAGLPLPTASDLFAGRALSADITGRGWRERLGYATAPVLSHFQAGQEIAKIAKTYDFAFFEYWLSDYAGHQQDMGQAVALLENFDQFLNGLVNAWDMDSGLILITSDHGNLEDLSTRRHTANPVPALLIGSPDLRAEFSRDLHDITGIAPAVLRVCG